MSKRKEFARNDRGFVLIGDSRDIAVSFSKRQNVYEWCSNNKITVEYKGTLAGIDLWRIKDEHQRALFALRWE